jgi:OHCU decarboxylase
LSDGLARFNSVSGEEAETRLHSCFPNHLWAARVAGGRPHRDLNALLEAAESAWSELAPSDWLQAFQAHPRIGERGGHEPARSESEQSRVMQGSDATLEALAAENRLYEDRFGHVFLIAAAGKSADEILQALRVRMNNDPRTELDVAAHEQRKITRMRLEQLIK